MAKSSNELVWPASTEWRIEWVREAHISKVWCHRLGLISGFYHAKGSLCGVCSRILCGGWCHCLELADPLLVLLWPCVCVCVCPRMSNTSTVYANEVMPFRFKKPKHLLHNILYKFYSVLLPWRVSQLWLPWWWYVCVCDFEVAYYLPDTPLL